MFSKDQDMKAESHFSSSNRGKNLIRQLVPINVF